MEKMFVYSDTVESAVAADQMNWIEPPTSRAGAVSLQCKRYRAVLEQCLESEAVAARTAASRRGHLDSRVWDQLQKRA
jgi:hypothetical protein